MGEYQLPEPTPENVEAAEQRGQALEREHRERVAYRINTDYNPFKKMDGSLGSRKKCYTCGELKPRSEYHNDNKNTDGVKGSCKECVNERAKQNYAKRMSR